MAAEALKFSCFARGSILWQKTTSFGGFIAGQRPISCGIITVSVILDSVVEQGE